MVLQLLNKFQLGHQENQVQAYKIHQEVHGEITQEIESENEKKRHQQHHQKHLKMSKTLKE